MLFSKINAWLTMRKIMRQEKSTFYVRANTFFVEYEKMVSSLTDSITDINSMFERMTGLIEKLTAKEMSFENLLIEMAKKTRVETERLKKEAEEKEERKETPYDKVF